MKMKVTATLDYGPLDIELSSENREEVEKNLLGIIEFIDENREEFEESGLKVQSKDGNHQAELDSAEWSGDTGDKAGSADDPLADLARELNVVSRKLNEIVYVDPDEEERPYLMVEGDKLGDSVPEIQRNAAFVLLTVLKECYHEDEMKTSEFKHILTVAEISDNDLYKAWDESVIDSSGRGRSATISLTGPGRREAKSVLKDLAKEME